MIIKLSMFIFSFIKYEYFTHSLVFTHLGGIDQGRARAVDCKLAALLSQSGQVQLPADYPTTLTPPEITKTSKQFPNWEKMEKLLLYDDFVTSVGAGSFLKFDLTLNQTVFQSRCWSPRSWGSSDQNSPTSTCLLSLTGDS